MFKFFKERIAQQNRVARYQQFRTEIDIIISKESAARDDLRLMVNNRHWNAARSVIAELESYDETKKSLQAEILAL